MKNQCKISSAWMMIFLLGLVIPVLFPFVKSRGVLQNPVQHEETSEDSKSRLSIRTNDCQPAIQDICEYNLKSIHNVSIRHMKVVPDTWTMIWVTAALLWIYAYKVFFQGIRLITLRLSNVSRNLLILQEKDGKK